MREILFRGKNPVSGEWAYGWFYSVRNAFNEKHILKIIIDVHGNETFVNPETVGQYTGLTDKNGKKIFEGDIVKFDSGEIMIINWDKDGAMFILQPEPYESYEFYCVLQDEIEVIGNIHDNPELLKGSAENDD